MRPRGERARRVKPRPWRALTLLLGASTACVAPLAPPCPEPWPIPAGGFAAPVLERVSRDSPAVGRGVSRAITAAAPLDLLGLQNLAVDRNPSVGEWNARVAAAQARRRAARSAFFPELRAEGRYLRLDEAIESEIPTLGKVTFQEEETLSVSTQLRYTVLDWGRSQERYRASVHDVREEEASRRRAIQGVARAAARLYFGLLEARRDESVIGTSVKTLEGALRLVEDFESLGRATRADVLVVRARLERRRFQLLEARDLTRDLEDELNRLLDFPYTAPLNLEEPEALGPDLLETLDVEAVALDRRSEIAALREAHEALARRASALGRSYLPAVFFFLQHDLTDSRSALTEESLLSGGFGLDWQFFDGGRRFHEARALEAEAQRLRSAFRATVARVEHEVRRAVRGLNRNVEALRVARVVVRQAEENLRRVEELFRNGKATGQEVLEAESLLTAERAREVRAVYDQHVSLAEVRYATGLDPGEALKTAAFLRGFEE